MSVVNQYHFPFGHTESELKIWASQFESMPTVRIHGWRETDRRSVELVAAVLAESGVREVIVSGKNRFNSAVIGVRLAREIKGVLFRHAAIMEVYQDACLFVVAERLNPEFPPSAFRFNWDGKSANRTGFVPHPGARYTPHQEARMSIEPERVHERLGDFKSLIAEMERQRQRWLFSPRTEYLLACSKIRRISWSVIQARAGPMDASIWCIQLCRRHL